MYVVIIRHKYRVSTREEAEELLRKAGDYNDAIIVRVEGGD